MLEHFFGSKTRLKLLKIFFRSPDQTFYVRELARLIGTHLHAVRREIANLKKLTIIKQAEMAEVKEDQESGTERSIYYTLNLESPLHFELKALINKAELMEEKDLIEQIKNKGGKINLFVLTGFFTDEKDITTDIVVVGKIKPLILSKIIRRYEKDLGKTIRYTFMSEQEFKDRRHVGDRFLYSIFEAKHVFVVNEYNLT